MRLAFWNNGVPKEIDPARVRFPSGDVAYDASPDPNRDLYEFSKAKEAACHPWQKEAFTYTLTNSVIIETRSCTWPPITELKVRKKAQVTAKRQTIAAGVILVGGLKVKCTDGNVAELEILISQAARGKVTFPVKATTSTGVTFQFTNIGEVQGLLDAVQAHRQAARNVDYDHLTAIAALTDPQTIADYDHTVNWPLVGE